MRRFIPAAVVAILLIAVATPANAGYLIIRVILDGSGSGSAGGMEQSSGGPRPPMGMSPPSTGLRPGGPPAGDGTGPMSGGAASTATFVHDPSRSLVVVVPILENLNDPLAFYPKSGVNHITNPIWRPKLRLNHNGQRFITNLFTDNVSVQLYDSLLQTPAPRKTRVTEIQELYYKWTKSKTDPKLLYAVLTGALESGMVIEAVKCADELLAFTEEKPDALPGEIAAFAKAYRPMQKGITSPSGKLSNAEDWKIRLEAKNVTTSGHYSLISWDAGDAELQRRIMMLEENFKGFFLWHATRGIELPIPQAPLIAVLPMRGGDVFNLAKAHRRPDSVACRWLLLNRT